MPSRAINHRDLFMARNWIVLDRDFAFRTGVTGAVQITRDGGQSWEKADLPVEPNSVVYWLANNPEMPNVVAAASLFGYVYVSEDGGNSWSKLQKEFGEIRALAITPN